MKKDRLSDCLGDVDSKYIDESENYKKKSRKSLLKYGAVAACVCLIGAGLIYSQLNPPESSLDPRTDGQSSLSISDDKNSPDGGNSVSVPKLELPEGGSTADMMGLIVYNGNIYTQASYYHGEDAEKLGDLVGDYLGYATGNIDEWSNQDDYATEFASVAEGNVYSVNGYSTDFRLCIRSTEVYEGKSTELLFFYELLTGIELTTGEDLFGTCLNLLENWDQAKYQTHENWDTGWPDYVYNDLDSASEGDLDSFIQTLYDSKFEYVYEQNQDFYDNDVQAHLIFNMADGTEVELRLFEGGYVGYSHMGWFFVKMPGEAFDVIFNACLGID